MQHRVVKKTLSLGKVDGYNNNRKSCALEITLEITQHDPHLNQLDVNLNPVTESYFVLSLTGDLWNSGHTDILQGGQMQDSILDYVNTARTRKIVELWNRWHLNDMRPGTATQAALLELRPGVQDYTARCRVLAVNDLLIDRGYKYGSAWLVEYLPTDVLIELAQLFNATWPIE